MSSRESDLALAEALDNVRGIVLPIVNSLVMEGASREDAMRFTLATLTVAQMQTLWDLRKELGEAGGIPK